CFLLRTSFPRLEPECSLPLRNFFMTSLDGILPSRPVRTLLKSFHVRYVIGDKLGEFLLIICATVTVILAPVEFRNLTHPALNSFIHLGHLPSPCNKGLPKQPPCLAVSISPSLPPKVSLLAHRHPVRSPRNRRVRVLVVPAPPDDRLGVRDPSRDGGEVRCDRRHQDSVDVVVVPTPDSRR